MADRWADILDDANDDDDDDGDEDDNDYAPGHVEQDHDNIGDDDDGDDDDDDDDVDDVDDCNRSSSSTTSRMGPMTTMTRPTMTRLTMPTKELATITSKAQALKAYRDGVCVWSGLLSSSSRFVFSLRGPTLIAILAQALTSRC